MTTTDFKDLDEAPEAVRSTIATMTTNAVHLAGILKGSRYPAAWTPDETSSPGAAGSRRRTWSASSRVKARWPASAGAGVTYLTRGAGALWARGGRKDIMASTDTLGTYLNDHLGGANAGVEMARQLHQRAGSGPDAAELGRLADDIEHDRDELRALVEQLDKGGHPAKKAVGWIAGKAHQVAVDERLTGDEHLSMLLATESLALGIEGKIALWKALLAVEPAYPQLAGIDLGSLVDRARDQRGRIETVRLAAARRSFATPR